MRKNVFLDSDDAPSLVDGCWTTAAVRDYVFWCDTEYIVARCETFRPVKVGDVIGPGASLLLKRGETAESLAEFKMLSKAYVRVTESDDDSGVGRVSVRITPCEHDATHVIVFNPWKIKEVSRVIDEIEKFLNPRTWRLIYGEYGKKGVVVFKTRDFCQHTGWRMCFAPVGTFDRAMEAVRSGGNVEDVLVDCQN